MKSLFSSAALFVAIQFASAQGTLVFDQQSTDEQHPIMEGAILFSQLPAQSFSPSLDSVGFVRLRMSIMDSAAGLAVNLRSGSPTGPLLGSTLPIDQLTVYAGTLTFYFPTAISVTPGATYFFEPVIRSGNPILNCSQDYGYSGGQLFAGGIPVSPSSDLFFREGIVVPEPATASMIVAGLALFGYRRLQHHPQPSETKFEKG